MRTPEEIRKRIDDPPGGAKLFNFEPEALLEFLPFEHAEGLAKEGVTEEEWAEEVQPLTREAIVDRIRDYMEFAWGKALDHRGLSAGRSIQKFEGWVWLLDDEELEARFRTTAYAPYGAPQLALLCHELDLPIPEGEDVERMSKGLACREGCEEGCGL